LITSASRKVLLVRAFQEAQRRLDGAKVLAADVSRWSPALYEADEIVDLPRTDDPGFVESLVRACADERIGLVVPTRDEELPVLAGARQRLADDGTAVLVSPPAAVTTCRDKVMFAAAVEAAGLDTPRIFPTRDVPLPAFVKARIGAGGRGATVVTTRDALEAARAAILATGNEPVVQEFIDGPEYTVDVFIDPDGRAISCVPRERVVVVAGESVVSRTVRDPGLRDAVLRLCAALGLMGHVTVQAFRSPARMAFIEINPRYGGAAHLGFEAGAPTPEFAIRSARGERLEPRLDDYEADLVMLRYADDKFLRSSELGGEVSG
jgi:carbamoyl-phosphate synthase large subunit